MPSIKLFEKLGYKKFADVQCFSEVHYAFEMNNIMSLDDF